MTNDTDQLTVLLRAWNGGSGPAGDAVMAMVYERIRTLAASRIRREAVGSAIQPTELELSYLVGLAHEDIAGVLDISLPTVNRDLRFAKTWLRQRLQT
jgi:hypothetical protein